MYVTSNLAEPALPAPDQSETEGHSRILQREELLSFLHESYDSLLSRGHDGLWDHSKSHGWT